MILALLGENEIGARRREAPADGLANAKPKALAKAQMGVAHDRGEVDRFRGSHSTASHLMASARRPSSSAWQGAQSAQVSSNGLPVTAWRSHRRQKQKRLWPASVSIPFGGNPINYFFIAHCAYKRRVKLSGLVDRDPANVPSRGSFMRFNHALELRPTALKRGSKPSRLKFNFTHSLSLPDRGLAGGGWRRIDWLPMRWKLILVVIEFKNVVASPKPSPAFTVPKSKAISFISICLNDRRYSVGRIAIPECQLLGKEIDLDRAIRRFSDWLPFAHSVSLSLAGGGVTMFSGRARRIRPDTQSPGEPLP